MYPLKLAAQIFLVAIALLALACRAAETIDIVPDPTTAVLETVYAPSPCDARTDDDKKLCKWLIDNLMDGFPESYLKKFTYTTASVDLNSDSRPEILVRIPPETGIGGTMGYPIYILSPKGDGFQNLLFEEAFLPVIELKTKTHGWNDIAIQFGSGLDEWSYCIFRFDGKEYQFSREQKEAPAGELLLKQDHAPTVFGPIPAK